MFLYLILAYYLPVFKIGLVLGIACLTMFPDMDILFGFKHRHWFFHSNIAPIIQFFVYMNEFSLMMLVAVTIHLVFDFRADKVGGTYCIHGMNFVQSTVYYLVSIGLGITIIVLFIT